MNRQFEGKVAVVTSAASSIGLAAARSLVVRPGARFMIGQAVTPDGRYTIRL